MIPRPVTRRYALKTGEAYAEWNYNTMGSGNFYAQSDQQTKSLIPRYKN
jgi:hypothetical protein